ncbi:MAG: tetratricopeptide repeat-containing glycosyltransferase family protein [Terracidiphilus sp.]|jgi:tetratricopeptide (TPR) repeat protein
MDAEEMADSSTESAGDDKTAVGPQMLQQPSPAMVQEALRLHQEGRLADAERTYLEILSVDPNQADCLHLLGMIAYQNGQHENAAYLIRKAIAIKGNAATYHSNLGNVLQAQGKLAEAGACYQRALVLKPDLGEVWVNLGNIFKAQREVNSSLTCYRRALALNPDLAEAAVGESMALLLSGEFTSGWIHFDRRWETKDFNTPMRAYPQPLWKGEKLAPGQLLIWGEQGIGDEIMFAGLMPDVIRTANGCVLDCDARLRPLFARSFPDVDVVSGFGSESHPELEISAHLPSGSLPRLFRATTDAFGSTTSPYLVADPKERERFRNGYGDGRRMVGLAWYTKNKTTGIGRCIELATLASLFSQPDIQWISLQYGDHSELERKTVDTPIVLDRTVDQFTDIDRFASQISAMDLVITIDNSTAHLAGALGIPTWVLLPYAPDWRWMLDRDDSPWYPTMRLFRQPQPGDWQSVVRSVKSALGD